MLERLLAEIRANNKKVEVRRGVLISHIGAHHVKIEVNNESQSGKNGSPDGRQSRDDGSLPGKD
jgi:hypothetical protein